MVQQIVAHSRSRLVIGQAGVRPVCRCTGILMLEGIRISRHMYAQHNIDSNTKELELRS